MPEAHTDFILAVITEEMGFIGILVLAILYSVLYYAILRLVIYGKIIAIDFLRLVHCYMLVTTTVINMGVVAGLFQIKDYHCLLFLMAEPHLSQIFIIGLYLKYLEEYTLIILNLGKS